MCVCEAKATCASGGEMQRGKQRRETRTLPFFELHSAVLCNLNGTSRSCPKGVCTSVCFACACVSAISTRSRHLALRRPRACATCISTTIPHAARQGVWAKVGARASRDTLTVDGRDLSTFLDGRCGARQMGTCICSRTARDEAPHSRAHAFTRPRPTQAGTSRHT